LLKLHASIVMEAIPKLSMVGFDPKQSPENLDLAAKLRQLIAERFGEDPGAFAAEIKELETLRANSCIRMSETIDGVATLKKYYCQLIFLQNRYRNHVLYIPYLSLLPFVYHSHI
jgi:hypothetical protein